MSLDHLPNCAISSTLIIVQPRKNDFSLGNDCLDHFLRKWISCTNLQNIPFFKTAHNCELQKNDYSMRQTIILDHYLEWLPRRMTILDHSPTLDTRGITVYGTSTIYWTIFIMKMTSRSGPFSELEKWLSVRNLEPLFVLERNCLA